MQPVAFCKYKSKLQISRNNFKTSFQLLNVANRFLIYCLIICISCFSILYSCSTICISCSMFYKVVIHFYTFRNPFGKVRNRFLYSCSTICSSCYMFYKVAIHFYTFRNPFNKILTATYNKIVSCLRHLTKRVNIFYRYIFSLREKLCALCVLSGKYFFLCSYVVIFLCNSWQHFFYRAAQIRSQES